MKRAKKCTSKKNFKLNLKCTEKFIVTWKNESTECIFRVRIFSPLCVRKNERSSKWMLNGLHATIWMQGVCVRVCLCGFLYEMRKNLCTLAVTNDFRSRITFSLLTCSLCVSLFSCTFFCTLMETKVLRRSSFFATTVTVPRLQSKNASVFFLQWSIFLPFCCTSESVCSFSGIYKSTGSVSRAGGLRWHMKWNNEKIGLEIFINGSDCSVFCLFAMVSLDSIFFSSLVPPFSNSVKWKLQWHFFCVLEF